MEKLKTEIDFYIYAATFGDINGYTIPSKYFENQNVWVLFDEKRSMLGGFALIDEEIPRSLDQIPSRCVVNRYKGTVTEFTGYFIKNKKGSFKLTLRLVIEVLKNKNNLFIYSYTDSNSKLKKYYSKGDPSIIYRGKPKRLEGHFHRMPIESVEMLTKWGIIKIFLHRTTRYFKW